MNKQNNTNHSYIFTRETLGMTVLLFCALMFVILITHDAVFASLGAAICTFMYGTFGYASYLVVAALVVFGVWLTFEKAPRIHLRTVAAAGLTAALFFMLFHAVTTRDFNMDNYGEYLARCYTVAEGGYAGYTFGGVLSGIIVYPIARGTTYIGAYVIFSIMFLLSGYPLYLVVKSEWLSRGSGRGERRFSGKKQNDAADRASVAAPQREEYFGGYAQDANVPANAGYAPQNYVGEDVTNYGGFAPQPGYDGGAAYVEGGLYDGPREMYGSSNPESVGSSAQSYFHVQPSERPVEDDKFSQEKLGRKILFENGEFAAESYRRNMIFNDDSYFNHPVHNDGDYLSSFSGKKPSPTSSENQNNDAQNGGFASYTQSYSEEVERNASPAPSSAYIYGEKPVEDLNAYAPEPEEGEDSDEVQNFGGGFRGEDYGLEDDYIEGSLTGGSEESAEENADSGYSIPSQPADMRGDASDEAFGRTFGRDGGELFGAGSQGRGIEMSDRGSSVSDRSFGRSDEPFELSSDRRSSMGVNGDKDIADDTDFSLGGDGPRLSSERRIGRGQSEEQSAEGSIAREEGGVPYSEVEGGEDARFTRRGGESLSDRGSDSNDLRNLFSSANSNISEDVKPDSSRISARREDAADRENLFDGDEDDYLSEEPDLGTPGLRRGDDEASVVRQPIPMRPAQEQPQPVAEEKPKHVWKKYVRPTLDLLVDYPEKSDANLGDIEESKATIIDTFENAHIAAHISNVTVGPAITRYDVIIEDRTYIKNAMRCRDAIAMALMKENVATYLNYAKGAISIEVPNSKRTIVGLKGMLTSPEFINAKSNSLTFALGKDVEGKPCCPDITKMPHLLVAGTTGSGKSICLSSLIISLLYKYGPDELRFILVDPKQSEFISYESLPHLIINEIISDVDKAIKALNWAIKEMERRYGLFKEMTLSGNLVRNLNEYNAHLPEGEEKLPKIVIILDEFGDLMLQRKKDIESRIIRLVQKARACGIHLILATQRPSVDCITGLIKSNLPTRIGFKVNSFDDSRTIFDIGGAEKLLGAGDMYFRSAQAPDLARIQGCFIDSPEVQAVTDFVKKNNETYFDQSVSDFINTVEEPEGTENAGDDGGEGDVKIDDKFIQALKFCVTSNQASVSMLQRRFPIGYVKACKIIDWMENMNYITQSEGSKPRKVLLSLDEFTRIYGDVDD